MRGIVPAILYLASATTTLSPSAYYESQIVRVETETGTGFYLRSKGRTFVVSNAHVCDVPAGKQVTLADDNGKKFKATVLKKDKQLDLCLIDSDNHKGLRLAFQTYCGEEAHAAGFANAGPYPFQVDAILCDHVFENYVIPGHSGSPVVNWGYQVVGVLKQRELDRSIGYVVTLSEIKSFMEEK